MSKVLKKEIIINAPVEAAFDYLDDLSKTGMHMSESSAMMMGSKLTLEHLPGPESGAGAKYRWFGKMMGLPLDFTVEVTKWIKNEEKTWETIGAPKMIILGWYRMRLMTEPDNAGGTRTWLEIEYTPPEGLFYRFLSAVFAPIYARWCVSKMLTDAKIHLEKEH
jgi:hypothetical protein